MELFKLDYGRKITIIFSSFTNKRGGTKISANFKIEFAKKLGSLEEEAFKGFDGEWIEFGTKK